MAAQLRKTLLHTGWLIAAFVASGCARPSIATYDHEGLSGVHGKSSCSSERDREPPAGGGATAPPPYHARKDRTGQVFELRSASNIQRLRIHRISSTKIQFELAITGSCVKTIAGQAERIPGDYEVDEDESGTAYFSEEFVRDVGDCLTSVRLSVDPPDKAVVIESGCRPVDCATSERVMRLLSGK